MQVQTSGILLPGMFLIFLYLKLTEVIDWSWWLVTAPLWGGFAFALVCLIIFAAAIGGRSNRL